MKKNQQLFVIAILLLATAAFAQKNGANKNKDVYKMDIHLSRIVNYNTMRFHNVEKGMATYSIAATTPEIGYEISEDNQTFAYFPSGEVGVPDHGQSFTGAISLSTTGEGTRSTPAYKYPNCRLETQSNCRVTYPARLLRASFDWNRVTKQGEFVWTKGDEEGQVNIKATATTKGCESNNEAIDVSDMARASLGATETNLFNTVRTQPQDFGNADVNRVTESALDALGWGGVAHVTEEKDGSFKINYSSQKTFVQDSTETTYSTTLVVNIYKKKTVNLLAIIDPISKVDYEKWLPEGPDIADENSKQGNDLTFRIRIVDKDDPSIDLTTARCVALSRLLHQLSAFGCAAAA
jgi:hypothetical protein